MGARRTHPLGRLNRAMFLCRLLPSTTCFLLFPLVQYASAQTAIIDWSQVRVAADGSTEFGPTVEVGESRLNASGMLGYFGNSDGFYGRPSWTEIVQIMENDDGRIEALKVLGDANVPRGRVSFRTASGHQATERMAIQLQLRDDPSDPNGFEWSPGNHQMVWDLRLAPKSTCLDESPQQESPIPQLDSRFGRPVGEAAAYSDSLLYYCRFSVLGPNPAGHAALFYRVSASAVRWVANNYPDAD